MTTAAFAQLAHRHFERAKHKAEWRDLYSRLTRKCNHLLAFDQVRQGQPLKGQRYRGLQIVPIDSIVGSEGRSHDFDRAFFPRQTHTQERWISIDQAHHNQTPLPPVDLVKMGEMYFVRDGNHRISVARAHGQEFIDAYVTEIEMSGSLEHAQAC